MDFRVGHPTIHNKSSCNSQYFRMWINIKVIGRGTLRECDRGGVKMHTVGRYIIITIG